jgi:hypothetical protein
LTSHFARCSPCQGIDAEAREKGEAAAREEEGREEAALKKFVHGMRGAYPDQLATLAARSQELLLDFLQNDLDLAFTFLATARIEADSDAEHARARWKMPWRR